MKRNRLLSFFIFISFLLTSCGNRAGVTQEISITPDISSEVTTEYAVGEYEVPVIQPNVFVNRLGYEPTGQKIAIFRGENLPQQFSVCRKDTKEVIFRGYIKDQRYDDFYEENDGFGDFSEVTEQGDFYIQADGIGESYPFMIHDSLYFSLFQKACTRFFDIRSNKIGATSQDEGWLLNEVGQNKEILACRCAYLLLLSYELFPSAYTDETGIPESGNQIPDILDEIRYEAEWILNRAESNPNENGTACAYRVAMLCKLHDIYKTMEPAFAKTCLNEAQNSYKSVKNNAQISSDNRFLAEVELFRATGNSELKASSEEYLITRMQDETELTESDFWGAVTYLSTAGPVDVSICNITIKHIMEEAERIAGGARHENYFVYSERAAQDLDLLLNKVMHMCVVNHVITNHEYNTVIENHFHYMMGRNPFGFCYALGWNGKEIAESDIFANPYRNAELIFMLSELVGNNG